MANTLIPNVFHFQINIADALDYLDNFLYIDKISVNAYALDQDKLLYGFSYLERGGDTYVNYVQLDNIQVQY